LHSLVKSLGGFSGRFYTISISSFLFQLPGYMAQPVLALYLLHLGASLPEVGLILSIQSMLMIFLRIPLTMVTQRLGEERMIKLAFVVQASAYIVYYIAPSPAWFYLIPFYQILATGSFNQLALSGATNAAPRARQGDAIGQYMTFMHAGQFIGPLITSVLLRYIGYSGIFLAAALFPAIGLALFLGAGFRAKMEKAPDEPKGVGSSSGLAKLGMVLKEKDVRLLAVVRVSYSLSSSIFTTLFPVWAVNDLQLSSSVVALLFSVIGFANTVIRIPVGKLADRMGAKRVLFLTFLVIIVDYVVIAYSRNIYLLGLAILGYGACSGIRAVSEWTHLVDVVEPEIKTLSMSFLFNCWDLGAMLGSISAGLLTTFLPFQMILLLTAFINVPTVPAINAMKNVHTGSGEE
jgi:DHA1 family multidrug resistance protein-like MFS transporter